MEAACGATALWAMNALLGNPVMENDLLAWSSEVGSDVPFFFSSGTAVCTGRGEQVESLPPLPEKALWVVKPEEGLPTPAVFRQLDLGH